MNRAMTKAKTQIINITQKKVLANTVVHTKVAFGSVSEPVLYTI